jgi:multidrug efflux pump subunit AcrA (membrane-fusion protein)
VGSQADANTLTFPVRVERVNSEPDDPLLPGMIARVSITVKEHRDVLVVPREIIHDEGGRLTAFVVEENRARKRRLTLGADEKGMVIVSEGLAPGDRVVCVGHQMLDEGIAVQIDEGDRSTGTSQEPQSLQEPPTP